MIREVGARVVVALAAAFVGAATAVAAIAVHRSGSAWLVLAVVASTAVAGALRATESPGLSTAYCVGWVTVLGAAMAGRPEGDYVLAGDGPGYVMMVTGFALVVLGVTALGHRGVRAGT